MMRVLFVILFLSNTALAEQAARTFVCDSVTTSGGSTSTLSINADTGDIYLDETPLYTNGIYCGLKLKAVTCQKSVVHNLDDAAKTHEQIIAKYTCQLAGIEMEDTYGYLESNLAGDGNGYFKCGRFEKNNLILSNCRVTSL